MYKKCHEISEGTTPALFKNIRPSVVPNFCQMAENISSVYISHSLKLTNLNSNEICSHSIYKICSSNFMCMRAANETDWNFTFHSCVIFLLHFVCLTYKNRAKFHIEIENMSRWCTKWVELVHLRNFKTFNLIDDDWNRTSTVVEKRRFKWKCLREKIKQQTLIEIWVPGANEKK